MSTSASLVELLSDLTRTLTRDGTAAPALDCLCRDDRIRGCALVAFRTDSEVVLARAGGTHATDGAQLKMLRDAAEDAEPGTVLQFGLAIPGERGMVTRELCAPVVRAGRAIGALLATVAADPEDQDGELIELVRVAAALIIHGVADLAAAGGPLTERVAAYERALIEQALAATRGRRSEAARRLQVTERILRYRVERYGIDHTRFRR